MTLRLALAAAALLAHAGVALAQDGSESSGKRSAAPAESFTARDFDASFTGRFVTDYNFRGISQTALRPGVQGSVEFTYGGLLYAGVAPYSVRLPSRPSAEIDITGGIRPKLGDFNFDLGFIRYVFPNETQFISPSGGIVTPKDTDYTEIAGKVSYDAGPLKLGLNAFHGFSFLRTGSDNTYIAGVANYSVPKSLFGGTILSAGQFSLSGEIGHQFFSGRTTAALGSVKLPDYIYGNLGVAFTYDAVTLDLRYHDTTLSRRECFALTGDPKGVFSGSERSRWCGAAFIATVSANFSASELGIFAPR